MAPRANELVLGRSQMKKTLLGTIGAALIAVSVNRPAVASPQPHTHRATVSAQLQFRNANNSIARPSATPADWANYGEAGVTSAPAGR
jgi:hypothetical protein